MINEPVIREYLKAGILDFYRHLYRFQRKANELENIDPRTRGPSLHEFVKGLLFQLAREEEMLPLPDYRPIPGSAKRIDMLWTDFHGEQFAGFEVDGSVKTRSVEKLLCLRPSCWKYVVSVGRGIGNPRTERLLGTDIVRIDVTQASIGVLDYF